MISDDVASYKRRLQKEKDALAKEGKGFRNIAFALTLVSMTMALSFIPFFPQPLPILVALLVAFLVSVNPAVGMPLGAISVVLGLLYQLSLVDFIGMLGIMEVRVLFISLLVFFFVALPLRFRSYEDSIGINLGIIAAMMLFFDATFFMAIPLLLTVGILFKKTQSGLAVSYYVLISVPLMILQYFQHILTIARVDFWNNPTAIPPIYTSLSGVFRNMQDSMGQFRLFDVSISLGKIPWNVVEPTPGLVHTVSQAVTQYTDSFPGIIFFIAIVAGLVWAISLILPSIVKKSNMTHAEKIFPALAAAGVTALFFLFMTNLQHIFAFSTKITSAEMVLGILTSMAFAVPAAILNFAPKKKAAVEKNSQIILVKAGDLMTRLQAFEDLLNKVKQRVPVDVNSPETKMLMIKDKLNDIITKTASRKFKVNETYNKIKELDTTLAEGINSLPPELDVLLEQYQLSLNYSYTNWTKKLKEIGYEYKNPLQIEFQKDQPPEARIEYIRKVLDASRISANEVCELANKVYGVIRNMFDPTLPEESRAVSYSKQRLSENVAPWIACDALIIAIKNWAKQYSVEISKSIASLQESLGFIIALNVQNKTLQAVLGERYQTVVEEIKKAQDLKLSLEQNTVRILNITVLSDSLELSLQIAAGILATLHNELKDKEESIESLKPLEAGFWEKNVTLREQTASAVEKISNPKSYNLRQMMQNLPQALTFIDPCLWTIDQYYVKNELLLNYPIAKSAIEELLKKKKSVTVQDLPFEASDAEEYLKLFFGERSRDFTFDEENLVLERKRQPKSLG